jgi:hypothetical protein
VCHARAVGLQVKALHLLFCKNLRYITHWLRLPDVQHLP